MSDEQVLTAAAGWCAPSATTYHLTLLENVDREVLRLYYGSDPIPAGGFGTPSYEETMNMDTNDYPANTAPGVYDQPTLDGGPEPSPGFPIEAVRVRRGGLTFGSGGGDATVSSAPAFTWTHEASDAPEESVMTTRATSSREDAVAEMLRASARLLEASANALDAR